MACIAFACLTMGAYRPWRGGNRVRRAEVVFSCGATCIERVAQSWDALFSHPCAGVPDAVVRSAEPSRRPCAAEITEKMDAQDSRSS